MVIEIMFWVKSLGLVFTVKSAKPGCLGDMVIYSLFKKQMGKRDKISSAVR